MQRDRREAEAAVPNPFALDLDWRRGWWKLLPEIAVMICAVVLSVILGANVIARYTNWFRVLWSGDVAKVLFLWIVFLGGALAVKYDAHIKMTMLSERINPNGLYGRVLGYCVTFSPILVGCILILFGIRVVEISMYRELPTLHVTVGYFMLVIPVSGALIVLYTLAKLLPRRSPPSPPPSSRDAA